MIGAFAGSTHAAVTTDFENLPLTGSGTNSGDTGSYWNGSDNSASFVTDGLQFNNSYVDYGGGFYGWDGWAYSNVNDVTTPGIGNRYATYTGTGYGDTGTYAVGYMGDLAWGGHYPIITIPDSMQIQSAMFTNTTYTALTMLNGDGMSRKFGRLLDPNDPKIIISETDAPDWLLLTITGKDATGSVVGTVDFYLADYRFENNALDYIVNDWQKIDLRPLAKAKTLVFSLNSSDFNEFGLLTPTFFAMDHMKFLGSTPGAVWSGTASNQWSDAANWGGTAPASGDSLLFNLPAGGISESDSSESVPIGGITFGANASSYTLTGYPVHLHDDLTNLSENAQTIDLPLVLTGGNQSIATAWGNITISKPIEQDGGSFGIEKVGPFTLTLSDTNTYTGPTVISEGKLLLTEFGNISSDSAITVAADATLEIAAGEHNLGTIDGTGTTIVDSDATLTATSITQGTLIIGSTNVTAVPEPGTFLLLMVAVSGLFFARSKMGCKVS
jgi:autotransporter-associated beta strand protein